MRQKPPFKSLVEDHPVFLLIALFIYLCQIEADEDRIHVTHGIVEPSNCPLENITPGDIPIFRPFREDNVLIESCFEFLD